MSIVPKRSPPEHLSFYNIVTLNTPNINFNVTRIRYNGISFSYGLVLLTYVVCLNLQTRAVADTELHCAIV